MEGGFLREIARFDRPPTGMRLAAHPCAMKSAPGSIDTSNVLSVCRVDGQLDHLLLREMLGYFLDENNRRMRICAAAVVSGDRESLRNVAHAIRGSAAIFGAGRLHDLAWALEQDAGVDTALALQQSVDAMRAEYEIVVAALRHAHPEAWAD